MLVDSHCHLDFPDFAENLDEVVARAGRAGVGTMLTIGTHLSKVDQVRAIAERFDNVYFTVGVHPHEAATEQDVTTARIVELSQHDKCIGIGECGLDYFYEHSPRQRQQDVFKAHIAAAQQTGLPLIVHTRDAEEDTLNIMAAELEQGAYSALIHCFSASKKFADFSVKNNFYISCSGIITFKKAQDVRDAIVDVPLERLLVETDAPYLAPVPKRGKTNEPSFVQYTNAKLAEIKGVNEQEMAAASTENFFRLFSKAKQAAA